MTSSIAIRPATSDDRVFVLGLLPRMASFELPPWRRPDEIVAGDYRPLAAWFDDRAHMEGTASAVPGHASEDALLIAELDGAPAGYAYLVVDIDFFTEKPHAHLSVLAVAKEAEGRGVGSALIEASTAWAIARGDDHITLNVFDGNRRAQALYERHGYAREIVKYRKTL
jgi:ribosomal protein S18 acetylase RimI-like enzyme